MHKQKKNAPWSWVPSLYFAEGLPNVAILTISAAMYKNFGLSNTEVTFYTGWLALPWVVKPLWSPFIDLLKTKRWWIVSMQLLLGAGFAGIAFCIPLDFYLQSTLALFALVAFASATHDIAADGFYMLTLPPNEQAFFVGIRSTFYRLSTLFGQGVLIYLAGYIAKRTDSFSYAWMITFLIIAGLFLAFFVYHKFRLPYPASDKQNVSATKAGIMREFGLTFKSFFAKKHALTAIIFMLTYRFSEAQLLKLIFPFLVDPKDQGGLGLDNQDYGIIYGTLGVIGLTIGGIIGGIVAAKGGLKKWLWPMLLSMLLTSGTFLYLAYYQPISLSVVGLCVVIEQFGYGFGFTAYVLYMMYFSEGEHKTAHYAICTGFMTLGLMLPGMAAGWIQEQLGYVNFFWWVMACSLIPILSACFLKIDPEYGKKRRN